MNNNSHLLPNITLGVEIRDDCGTVNTALEQCLNFLMGTLANKEQICSLADSSFRVQRSAVLGGVVGPSFSTTAIQVRMAYMLADCMYSKGLFTWMWETPDRCEVTSGGSVPHLSSKRDHIKMKRIIWTGGLPHLRELLHLPGVPHLHVNRPQEKDVETLVVNVLI